MATTIGTITDQGSAVATIFIKPRMLYVCEVILEYDAYDAEGVICRLQVAGCRLQVAGCRLQVAGCRLQVKYR